MATIDTSGTIIGPGPVKNPPANTEAGFQLSLLAIDGLCVDTVNYHRQPVEHRINTIQAHYTDSRLRAPVVTRRPNGTYWVIDGLQSVLAASRLGKTSVWATVLDTMNPAEEAKLYFDLNRPNRRINPTELHRAALAWDEPIAVAIEEVLSKFNFTAKHNSGAGMRNIQAVASLRAAWGPAGHQWGATLTKGEIDHGKAVLTWVIRAGMKSIRRGEQVRLIFSAANLRALIFIRRNAVKVPSLAKMQSLMKKHSATSLRSIMFPEQVGPRMTWGERWAHLLVEVLNKEAGYEFITLPAK